MPNTTEDSLYETFRALAENLGQVPNPITEASQELARSADGVSKAMESARMAWDRVVPVSAETPTSAATAKASTGAGSSDSASSTVLNAVFGNLPMASTVLSNNGSSGDGSSTVETILSTVFKSGFGLIPLVGGLLGLFGGGGSETTMPLVKYALPPTLEFQAAQNEWGLEASDYDQMGMPRMLEESSISASQERGNGNLASSPGRQTAQITVNVNAMDARSFLDRSNDIAAAVRDAMLNLNSINDVVNDL